MNQVEQLLADRLKNNDRLQQEAPNLFNGFGSLMKYYYRESALSTKTKELIAVGLSVAQRCSPCLAYHVNEAVKHGASLEEVYDTAAIGVEFGGGPAYVMVRNELMVVLDQVRGQA